MEVDYFESLTPRIFAAISHGRLRKIKEEGLDRLFNTRIVAYMTALPNMKKSMSIEKFMPIPEIDKRGKDNARKEHPWANKTKEDLDNFFGD